MKVTGSPQPCPQKDNVNIPQIFKHQIKVILNPYFQFKLKAKAALLETEYFKVSDFVFSI